METILMVDILTDRKFLADKLELEWHKAKYKEFLVRKSASNNWLKLHGYPMRRKVR